MPITRRQNANTFALRINTALIAVVGYVQTQDSTVLKEGFFWAVAVPGPILNFVWYRMVRSYRDLNTAKYLVIHEMEKRLVISPYDAEWEPVGRGKDRKLYLPFTRIEIWVPWIFVRSSRFDPHSIDPLGKSDPRVLLISISASPQRQIEVHPRWTHGQSPRSRQDRVNLDFT